MSQARTKLLAVTAVAGVLLLTGCIPESANNATKGTSSSSDSSSVPSPIASDAVFNRADLQFATAMVEHEQETLKLVETLLAKDEVNGEVTSVAEQIKQTQSLQLDTLQSLLAAWGKEVQLKPSDVSSTDIEELSKASGKEAERLFLEQMIEQQQEAVVAAESEVDAGKYPDATTLATTIVKDRTQQIVPLHDLLEGL